MIPCTTCEQLPWAPEAKRRCFCEGVALDLGSGSHKQLGFLGVDRRPLPKVDLVWDLEQFPWPFPDHCADQILASHLLEHIAPQHTITFWDELWRICKPEGQLCAVVPHGQSYGYLQDPTHCSPYVEATFAYFCPEHVTNLYSIYTPKPWRLLSINSYPQGNIEVIMVPLPKPQVASSSRMRSTGGKRRHAHAA